MLTEKMTYTVSAVTPNTQVGDIVYVKELDSGAHAIGEVDRIYAHGGQMELYREKLPVGNDSADSFFCMFAVKSVIL